MSIYPMTSQKKIQLNISTGTGVIANLLFVPEMFTSTAIYGQKSLEIDLVVAITIENPQKKFQPSRTIFHLTHVF